MTGHDQSRAQTYSDLVDLEYDRDVAPLYDIEPMTQEETESEAVPE